MRWWSKRLLNIWKCEEYNNLGIVWMSFTDHEAKACSPGWYWSEAVEPLGDGASGRLLGHGSVGPWSLFPPVYWSMEWKLSLAFLTWGLTKEHLPWGDIKFVLGISKTIRQNNSLLKKISCLKSCYGNKILTSITYLLLYHSFLYILHPSLIPSQGSLPPNPSIPTNFQTSLFSLLL